MNRLFPEQYLQYNGNGTLSLCNSITKVGTVESQFSNPAGASNKDRSMYSSIISFSVLQPGYVCPGMVTQIWFFAQSESSLQKQLSNKAYCLANGSKCLSVPVCEIIGIMLLHDSWIEKGNFIFDLRSWEINLNKSLQNAQDLLG